jgi:MFS family permease
MEVARRPVSVLRRVIDNRELRRVLPAYLAFNAAEFGTWVSILLYAYEQTGPASVGLVALLQLVPAALVAPAAAALGDRIPRQRVLAAGYLVQAAAMLATAAAMLASLPVLVVYLVAAVAASSLVVTRPTQSALLPSLARTSDELTAANGAAGVAEGTGVLAGPLAAAAILTVSTPATVFLLGGAVLVLAAAATIGLRPSQRFDEIVPIREGAAAEGGFLEGLRTVAADPDARLIVAILTIRMLIVGSADVLFVLLALDLLGIGEPGAAVLAAALGAGAIVAGGVTFALVGRNRLATVAAGGAVIWGIALAIIGLTATAWLATPIVVVGGAGLAIVDIAGRTMLQRFVRDEVLSRVFGLQEGLAMFGLAMGSVLVPVLVGLAGLVGSVLVVAAILPVAVVLTWGRLTALDRRSMAPRRELALLRRAALFRPLPAPQLEAVARRTSWLTVPAGTAVIREGEAGDRFYIVASGAVRVDRNGRHLRDIASPGEGFGEIALLRGVPRTATVTATEETVLLTIDRAPFLAAVIGHPDAYAAAEREIARLTM